MLTNSNLILFKIQNVLNAIKINKKLYIIILWIVINIPNKEVYKNKILIIFILIFKN